MKKIELFIHTKEHIQRDTEPTEHMKEAHRRTIWLENEQLVTSIHSWLPADEMKVKKIVEDFAKCQDLELVIYDRYKIWDNVRAIFKGIKTTPTVILGKHRFTANITHNRLKEAL
ncbi:MAG: hypothetical protein KAJ33_05300 [Thermoplasmata archaeon]|nr:hypothetical protein [Thermoplasmata archaeon]